MVLTLGSTLCPIACIYFKNHASSLLNPEFICTYIRGEELASHYSKTYSPGELEQVIGPFQTSPIGLVPKPNSNKLQMIQDLSYPRHDPTANSVNTGINSSNFPTTWGSFESTAELILSLPDSCVTATFDISAAYWITPIHPSQQNVLCVFWEGLVWVDQMIMFGMSSSAGVFGLVANMLVTIYEAAGFGLIRKWVDDFLAI